MARKHVQPKTRLELLQDELQALRRNIAKAHTWQRDLNVEIRERLGEVEAFVQEIVECTLKNDTALTEQVNPKPTRRHSRTNSRMNSASAVAGFSENSTTKVD